MIGYYGKVLYGTSIKFYSVLLILPVLFSLPFIIVLILALLFMPENPFCNSVLAIIICVIFLGWGIYLWMKRGAVVYENGILPKKKLFKEREFIPFRDIETVYLSMKLKYRILLEVTFDDYRLSSAYHGIPAVSTDTVLPTRVLTDATVDEEITDIDKVLSSYLINTGKKSHWDSHWKHLPFIVFELGYKKDRIKIIDNPGTIVRLWKKIKVRYNELHKPLQRYPPPPVTYDVIRDSDIIKLTVAWAVTQILFFIGSFGFISLVSLISLIDVDIISEDVWLFILYIMGAIIVLCLVFYVISHAYGMRVKKARTIILRNLQWQGWI